MTGTREPQQDGSIQAMLRDSGLEASTELRGSLEELRALVPDRAPAPRADLAALLAAGAPGLPPPGSPAATTAMPTVASAPDHTDEALPAGVTSLAERRGRKRRLAIVGGAVVGAMTLGAGAVAASSEDFRESVSHTVGIIFQPSGETPDVAPKPAKPVAGGHSGSSRAVEAAGATTPPTAADAAAGSRIRCSRFPRSAGARHSACRGPRRSPSDAAPASGHAGDPPAPRARAGTGAFPRIRCRSRPFPACFRRLPGQP